jgi:methionine sulfoxide reductase heme-binding subunit
MRPKQPWYHHWPHLVHPLALAPLALLAWDTAMGRLSFNPIQDATLRTGLPALVLLILSLACTPLNTLFGWKRVLTLRRPLGLYAFLYAAIHFTIFAVVDYGLDLGLIQQAIAEKPYVLVGFSALLLLIPLAITSTKGWKRRLGKGWKQLHKLVYLAIPLAVLHFIWLVKADIREPLLYGLAVIILLALRIPAVRTRIAQLRQGRQPQRAQQERRPVEPDPETTGT